MSVPLRIVLLLITFSTGLLAPVPSAFAESVGPAWTIRSLAQPTNFSAIGNATCEVNSQSQSCDSYTLLATNVGNGATNAPVTIADTLASGVRAVSIEGEDLTTERFADFNCTRPPAGPLQCVDPDKVPAGHTLRVRINVVLESGLSGSVVNSASVSGDGAPAVATSELTPIQGEQAAFGIKDFDFQALAADATFDLVAGGHPSTVTTSLYLNTNNLTTASSGQVDHTSEELKDVVVDLPLGFVGNPQATPRCPLNILVKTTAETGCQSASRVGTIVFEATPGRFRASEAAEVGETTAVYNMTPEAGYQAEFGFTFLGTPVFIYARAIRMGSTYGLQVTVPGIPELSTIGTSLTFFGQPAQRNGSSSSTAPFFTNPVDCSGGSSPAKVEVDTWQHPGHWFSATSEHTPYPQILGCEMLQFLPTLKAQPETTQADEPSGYGFEIEIPQNESPFSPGTPELKDASVTLPSGVSVSPSAADGLAACAATGPHGIDIPTGSGDAAEATEESKLSRGEAEGEAIGPDGFAHLTAGDCPSASTVGTVEITTPLLPSPLEGHVFLGQPGCGDAGQASCTETDAADGNLIHIYLEAAGSGVVIKLPGSVSLNRSTGQITATFKNNPQLPVGKIALHFDGGPRASLANPLTCGVATTTSDFSPWSSPFTPDATPASPFTVDWDGKGGTEAPCPATPPLAPSLAAGTVSPAAGAFSPFTFTLARGDRQQYLSQLSVTTPPGLLGMLSSVSLCGEPQAQQGTCSSASEIGTTTVAAGPGSHPFWITGHVYLTVGYRGAPFGLSIVVPAKAGPFNLGNVVVRSAISVDPATSALTVTSDPLPQIVDGIPLRIQTVNVTIGRPGFMFNPTNCEAKQITASVEGSLGATTQVSNPFAAAGCKNLPFGPKLTFSTQAKTSKSNGASLISKVVYTAGQANIKSVAVSLPKQLPARLTTIQKACLAATFAANPATCPAGSLIGIAKVRTPVLPVLLSGPVYLVSHGGAAFPDLVLILQGDGVRVDQTASIFIARNGITSSTFASVPDVPLTSFELNLPEGPHSALTATLPAKAKGSLCNTSLAMPATITGQNGKQVKQSIKIAVGGCPKVRKKASKTKTKKAKKASRPSSLGSSRSNS
jgi:hypothetical protein